MSITEPTARPIASAADLLGVAIDTADIDRRPAVNRAQAGPGYAWATHADRSSAYRIARAAIEAADDGRLVAEVTVEPYAGAFRIVARVHGIEARS